MPVLDVFVCEYGSCLRGSCLVLVDGASEGCFDRWEPDHVNADPWLGGVKETLWRNTLLQENGSQTGQMPPVPDSS